MPGVSSASSRGTTMAATRRRCSDVNRGTGIGLMAFSIVLVVIGAILEFAVTVTTSGFNIHTIGVILLLVGIVAFVASALIMAFGGRRSTTLHEDVRSVPGGRSRVLEERDSSTL